MDHVIAPTSTIAPRHGPPGPLASGRTERTSLVGGSALESRHKEEEDAAAALRRGKKDEIPHLDADALSDFESRHAGDDFGLEDR